MSLTLSQEQTDYQRFRGKCKEYCEAACADDSNLRLVRGHYYCPIWNTEEPHWWTVHQDGTIHDPTKNQFPSKGNGIYTEFNGLVACSECGREIAEDEAKFEGTTPFVVANAMGGLLE